MINFEQTHEFAQWLSTLKDKIGQARDIKRAKNMVQTLGSED